MKRRDYYLCTHNYSRNELQVIIKFKQVPQQHKPKKKTKTKHIKQL